MTRRTFGSIRKLPSGRWQARYPDGAGKLKAGPLTFLTKGDASRWLAVVEADMARGQFIDPEAGQITVRAWAQQWLDRPGKRPSSLLRDRQALEVFLAQLGHVRLSALTAGMVQEAVNARAKIAKPATVTRDFASFRAMINAAVDADMIGRSPVRKIAVPQIRPPERNGLTAKQLQDLLSRIPPRYRALILVAAVLGLRWGEAVGLRVRDIDFMRRTVTVAQVVEELQGHLRLIPEAKTRSSLRTIAAPPFVIEAIAEHLALYSSAAQFGPEDLVFRGPRGGILRRRFGERVLRPALSQAGLPESLTFHGLRHVAVTAMAEAGVPYSVTQRRVGHSTAKLTMELYSHRTTEADRLAALALERFFNPSGTDEQLTHDSSPSGP
jgi:integrase